jgi:hypothetical protein
MSSDPETTRIVRSWLEDGVTQLPDTVLDAVLDDLPSTHQRRQRWTAWRFSDMNSTVRIALAGAAIVVVAILGVQYLAPSGGFGGSPEPTPTVEPTPSASTEAAKIVIGDGLLAHAEVTTPRPDGWVLESNFAHKEGTDAGSIGFSAWTMNAVYPDPCRWTDGVAELSDPPTVDEIVDALVAQPGRDPSTPTETTLGGLPAIRLELVTPANLDISTCDEGRYKTWTDLADPMGGNWNHQSGQLDVIYVVDMDRGPVVIDAWNNLPTSDADLAALEGVLDAMVIEYQEP